MNILRHMEAHESSGAASVDKGKGIVRYARWFGIIGCLLLIAAITYKQYQLGVFSAAMKPEKAHEHVFSKWGEVQINKRDGYQDLWYQVRTCTECGLAEKRWVK